MATGDAPVLETVLEMTAVSLEHSELDPATIILLRLAALAAVDAPAASYLMHVGPGAEAGVTVDQVQDVLVAVAPIIGTARTVSAAGKIVDALGFTIALLEAELEAEADDE
jgi:alkylhydroperoxidase/carboxymuconolactone decarboxylase family protein YurZ